MAAEVVEIPDAEQENNKAFLSAIEFVLLDGERFELAHSRALWRTKKVWNFLATIIALLMLFAFGAASAILVTNLVLAIALAMSTFVSSAWVIATFVESHYGTKYCVVTNYRAIHIVIRGGCCRTADVKYIPLVMIRDITIHNDLIRLWPSAEARVLEMDLSGCETNQEHTANYIKSLSTSFRAQMNQNEEQVSNLTARAPVTAMAHLHQVHRSEIEKLLLQTNQTSIYWVHAASRWEILKASTRGPLLAGALLFPVVLLSAAFLLKRALLPSFSITFGIVGFIFIVSVLIGLLWNNIFSPPAVVLTRGSLIQSESHHLSCAFSQKAESKPLKKCYPIEIRDWQLGSDSGNLVVNASDAWPTAETQEEVTIIEKYNIQGADYIKDAIIGVESSRTSEIGQLNRTLWAAFVENWKDDLKTQINRKSNADGLYDIDL